jgi:hypothetical protein
MGNSSEPPDLDTDRSTCSLTLFGSKYVEQHHFHNNFITSSVVTARKLTSPIRVTTAGYDFPLD